MMKKPLLFAILSLATAGAGTILDFSCEIPPKNIPIGNDFPGQIPNGPGFDGVSADSYRERHPEVDWSKDRTWSPRIPEQQEDRIDFIYYKGGKLKPPASRVGQEHPVKFPSDHAAS